jgi:hypothetical protein
VLKGQKLKQFKAAFAHILEQYETEQLKDMDVTQLTELPDFQFGTRSKSLGVFNFRAFLNLGMLLVESEKARNVRSAETETCSRQIKHVRHGELYLGRSDRKGDYRGVPGAVVLPPR